MKSQGYILIVILIIGSLVLYPLESGAGTMDDYVFVVPIPKKSQEMKRFDVVPLLEIGDLPFPRPSRRQIIDADKGPSCLACHRLPYPTAPQKPAKPRRGRTFFHPEYAPRRMAPSDPKREKSSREGRWMEPGREADCLFSQNTGE